MNLQDGLVSAADTGRTIDTQKVRQLAKNLVSAVREPRLHLQQEVDPRCRAPERR